MDPGRRSHPSGDLSRRHLATFGAPAGDLWFGDNGGRDCPRLCEMVRDCTRIGEKRDTCRMAWCTLKYDNKDRLLTKRWITSSRVVESVQQENELVLPKLSSLESLAQIDNMLNPQVAIWLHISKGYKIGRPK